MPLTAEQKAKIKEILRGYKRNVRTVVKTHKHRVVQAVEDADKRHLVAVRQALQQK